MLLWAFYQTRRSTPISQGNRHMESQPSKDQTKSPGRHSPFTTWKSAGKLTLFDSANGVWKWVDGFRKPWDGWRISITAVVASKTNIVREKVSSSKSVLLTSIPNYIHLDSRNHNIEPQIELESIDAQPWTRGSNQVKPMQWSHQWFIEIASTVSSIFNHNHPFDAFNMVPCGRSM